MGKGGELIANVHGNEIQVVVFKLGQAEYGGDITRVQEIIRLPDVTALPNTADYILGIINLRGSIIPIIDLKKKFGFASAEKSDETRVIVVEIGSNKVGLIVDEVSEVVSFPVEEVVSADVVRFGIQGEHLLGVVRLDERLLILINLDKIIN